jgi:hypothetical protein
MTENEKEYKNYVDKKEKADMEEKKLPYCKTAPSAEHHRADNEDEPCDDGRMTISRRKR